MDIMGWIRNLLTSRYIKSVVRYLLAALIASMVNVPILQPLADLLSANLGDLTNVLAGMLAVLLAGWSLAKNGANAAAQSQTNLKVK